MAVHQDQSRHMAVALEPNGAMTTSDGGLSWRECGDTDEGLERILFDGSFSSVVFGYRSGVLYRSTDGCRSWSSFTDSRIDRSTFLFADPHRTQTLYAGVSEEVLVTRSGGRYWGRFSPDVPGLRTFDMAFSPTSAAVFFLAGEAQDARRGVFRSEDGGVHWQIDTTGLYAIGAWNIAIDPADPTVAFAGTSVFGGHSGNGVFKTRDSGESWAFLDGTEEGGPVLATDPLSPNTVYATSADWGLLKSLDGGMTWSEIWAGSSGRRIGQIEVDHHRAGTLFMVISEHYHEALRSEDGGVRWEELILPDVEEVYEVFSDPRSVGVVFASTEGGLFRSSDWGESWIQASDGLETPPECRPWSCGDYHSISDVAFDPIDANVVYAATEAGPYRSTDRGFSWEVAREGMLVCCEMLVWSDECDLRLKTSGPLVCEGWPLDLAIDPGRPFAVYATTSFGTYRSLDRGETWWLITELLDSLVQTIEAPGNGQLMGTSRSAGVVRFTTERVPSQRPGGHRTPTRQPSLTGPARPEKAR
jgi:photosystem II stability/assembly factor-like uncharacterized protein